VAQVAQSAAAVQVHFLLLFAGERDAVAVKPSVDGFTAEAEAAGKFADVGLWLAGEGNEFCTCSFTVWVLQGMWLSVGWDGVSIPMCPVHTLGEGLFPCAFSV